MRVKPSIFVGIALYLGYLAIFFSTWIFNKVDYPTIGKTIESTKLHYALPTLFGGIFLVIAISLLGWWKITLFDKEKSGPKWAWIAPIIMFILILISFANVNWDKANPELLLWSALGALGVGFGEEMITRGSLLIGLRSKFSEIPVWFISTLFFTALHIPNVFFGQPASLLISQLVLTFIMGSALYSFRRISGNLLIPIILHGLWDSAIFLPPATGATPSLLMITLYPIAIICFVAVLLKNRRKRLTI
jgi:hypothetical protein